MNCNLEFRDKLRTIIDSKQFLIELNKIDTENINDIKSIGAELATIHNESTIDIVAKFITITGFDDQSLLNNIINIFNHILPTVNSPVSDVLKCLSFFSTKGYPRLCANGLELYCGKQEERPNQVLSYSLSNIDASIDFISIALIAGAKNNLDFFINKTIELTSHSNEYVQNSALVALGRIDYSNNIALIDKVLNTIEKKLEVGHSESLYSSAIGTLINIYLNAKFCDLKLARLLKLAFANSGKETLVSEAELFFIRVKKIPDSVLYIFLDAFSKNIDVLQKIDHSLPYLLDVNKENVLVSFLEKILIENKNTISITVFSSLLNKIRNNNEFLNILVTRWFLSKKIILGKAINEIVGQNYDKNIELSVDTGLLSSESEGICLFLAKKACGWLFMSPISAVSFMLSLIDFASKSEVESINEIILNPLLLSYSGSVNEYLNNKLENGTISEKESINIILESIKKYHQGIEKAWNIKELQPSLTQREAYQRKHNEDLNKAYKEGSKNSFISNVFGKPQVMLYGNTSIYTMHGMNNSCQRQEAPLSQVKTSFEFPSLYVLDPHGIENKLWSFKTEGCTE